MNLYNSIVLLGTIQGFIFAFVVMVLKKYQSQSTGYLIALITIFSLSNLQNFIYDVGIIENNPFYTYIYMPWSALIGPYIYFYVKSFLNPIKISRSSKALWYSVFVIFLILTLVFKIGRIFNFNTDRFESFFALVLPIQQLFSILLTLIALIVSYVTILKYKKPHTISHININSKRLLWLRVTVALLIISTFVWVILFVFNVIYNKSPSFYPLWIIVSVLIYWLGHAGIYNYGIQQERESIRKTKPDVGKNLKPKNSNKTIDKFQSIMIEEQCFLDPNLTLGKMAERVSISKNYLSKLINEELKMSFTDYVNTLRVDMAKEFLRTKEFANYTLTAIGLEAGFNSKTSFYSTFKKYTGLTPSQFKSSL